MGRRLGSRAGAGLPLGLFVILLGSCQILTIVFLASNRVGDGLWLYLAGNMVWDGSIADAYTSQGSPAGEGNAPWGYPPPYNFLAASLAILPWPVSCLFFLTVTLAAYLLVLSRLAGDRLGIALVVVGPAILANIWSGQNGLLTGSLVGLFFVLALRAPKHAGLPLGLMMIKPHLVLGLGVLTLAWGRGTWLLQAVMVALALSALAALAFGAEVWTAFLRSFEATGSRLEAGLFPFHRMVSVYSSLRTFGMKSQVALLAQGALALCGALAIIGAVVQGWRAERTLAVAVLASLIVSPYLYDYDLALLGVAVALAMRDMEELLSKAGLLALGALTWFAAGYGMLAVEALGAKTSDGTYAPAGFALVVLVVFLIVVLWRAEHVERAVSA